MPILSDYFYRARELQKILYLILEKVNNFHCTCPLLSVNHNFFFFNLHFNKELCLYQLMKGISHWWAVFLKTWCRQCSCFIVVEGNINAMSLPGGLLIWSIWKFLSWCGITVLLSIPRWAVTKRKSCNFKCWQFHLNIRSYQENVGVKLQKV